MHHVDFTSRSDPQLYAKIKLLYDIRHFINNSGIVYMSNEEKIKGILNELHNCMQLREKISIDPDFQYKNADLDKNFQNSKLIIKNEGDDLPPNISPELKKIEIEFFMQPSQQLMNLVGISDSIMENISWSLQNLKESDHSTQKAINFSELAKRMEAEYNTRLESMINKNKVKQEDLYIGYLDNTSVWDYDWKGDDILRTEQKLQTNKLKNDVKSSIEKEPDLMTWLYDMIRSVLGLEKTHAGSNIKDWANRVIDDTKDNYQGRVK